MLDLVFEILNFILELYWSRWRWYSIDFKTIQRKFCYLWIRSWSLYYWRSSKSCLFSWWSWRNPTNWIWWFKQENQTYFNPFWIDMWNVKKSFFHTLLKFEPYWDYKPTNVFNSIAPGRYVNDKVLNINIINKIHLKCDVIDGSIQDGVRQASLFSFASDIPSG